MQTPKILKEINCFNSKKVAVYQGQKVKGHVVLKGTVAWDSLLPYHHIQNIDKEFQNCSDFGRTLATFSVFGECAKIFQQFIGTL